MTPERFREIEELYLRAKACVPEERKTFLDRVCNGDAEARQQIERMLAVGVGPEGILDYSSGLLVSDSGERLEAGQKLGPYRIESVLGSGGMGMVYRALDTRLGRKVAIKTSTSTFSGRFEREAQAISSLNHPHICQLYDVGPNYLVMELLEGETLAARLRRGPMKLDEALRLAVQIAEAMAAAHSKGIVHRDLKPGNIMIGKSGAKVLDFGLAKMPAASPGDAHSDSVTATGTVLGTVQYMSPEQAQGQDADARSDIFAFGCVLYEMLSGKRAFAGSSAASVIVAILGLEPESLKTTPPLDRVVRTCLAKDPDDRFQTARDLKRDLMWAMETPAVVAEPTPKVRVPWILFAATALIATVLAILYFRSVGITAPETRLDIVTPPTGSPGSFALSPDGRKIAYVASSDGASRLWVRSLDSTSAQPLRATENALNPFWAPDSRSVAFFAEGKLKRIDLSGGQPQILTEVSGIFGQGAWSEAGVILFTPARGGPLFRVAASGGPAVAATKMAIGQVSHRVPRFLPGGGQFLFASPGLKPELWLGSLDGADPRPITAWVPGADSAAEYLAPGWLIRVKGNVLVAQRFDAASDHLAADPVTLAQVVDIHQLSWAGAFSVAASGSGPPSGTIAWRSGTARLQQLIWFNDSGRNMGSFGAPDDSGLVYPELSPDNKRAAITRLVGGGIWMQESTRRSRFTFDPGDTEAIWSPDGVRVVFASNREGAQNLYQKPADGSGEEQLLLQSAEMKRVNSWSHDGRFILYSSDRNNGDLMILPLGGDRKPYSFLSTPFAEQQGVFSPDGNWVAYQSNATGRNEIHVRPFPGPGGEWQVSTGGAASPRWRPDGKELYYLAPDDKLMAVAVSAQGPIFAYGTPRALFQTHIVHSNFKAQYDVARDGRFLIDTELDSTSTEPIHLLLNWKPPAK